MPAPRDPELLTNSRQRLAYVTARPQERERYRQFQLLEASGDGEAMARLVRAIYGHLTRSWGDSATARVFNVRAPTLRGGQMGHRRS